MTHARFPHLARADDDHRLLREIVSENLLGQLDCHTADGGRTPADAGACADFLRRLKSLLENAIQHASSEPRGMGSAVRLLHLTRDLGLADDHRVESASDSEQMPHSLDIFVNVDMRTKVAAVGTEESAQRIDVASHSRYGAVDL